MLARVLKLLVFLAIAIYLIYLLTRKKKVGIGSKILLVYLAGYCVFTFLVI